MKKLGIIAMAFALVLGMSQCKKENTTASNDEGMKVSITLNVNGGNVSRVAVTPETGVVTFENGDVIHVVSNGVYVGTMTYDGSVFSGEINEPTEGQKLQFYFLGNKTPEFNEDNTGCSVVISDQTAKLPVISYAPSREDYQIGKTNYNATLLNKCALVKFDVTTLATTATCIKGMNNKVEIDFAINCFEYTQEEEGVICMAVGSGERWAILLPQDELEEGEEGSAFSYGGYYSGVRPEIPTIEENGYLTDGIAIEINTPVGFVDGLFAVSDFQQVYFSQGNLQYQASTNTWRFAEHQWDYVGTQTPDGEGRWGGTVNGSDNLEISQNYSGWIDLFGWGTSGYNHGAVCYQPWSNIGGNNYYYAYGDMEYNLNDQTGQADWGYNAISNGGNTENSGWRTLTNQEWYYVTNLRTGNRYAGAIVNGVKGLILLPDNWSTSIYPLNHINNSYMGFDINIVTGDDWTNIFEANGAVFLPTGGRFELNWNTLEGIGSHGYYWSASAVSDWYSGVFLFSIGDVGGGVGQFNRHNHHSVRLVRDAE